MKPKLITLLCFLAIVFGGCTSDSIAPNTIPVETIETTVTGEVVESTPIFRTATEQQTQTPTSEIIIPTSHPEYEVNIISEGQVGGSSEALAVSGQYVYLGVGPRLIVLDIRIPNNPQVVGRTKVLSGVVSGVAVKDDYVYVLTKTGYFGILMNDPVKPQLIGSVELQIRASKFAIADEYAFVAGGNAGLLIIDLSNKEIPKQAGSASTLYDASAISVIDNYAYVTERNASDINGALQVFDVSDPISPHVVGSLKLTYFAQAIAIVNEYAYLASNGLVVVDISDPATPRQVGTYEEVEFYDDVAIADGYAFISTNQYCDLVSVCPRQVRIIDISEPSTPQSPNIPIVKDSWSDLGVGRGVVVHNGSVYVAMESGLRVIDAASLTPIGQYKPVNSVDDIALSNGYGYTVDGYNSLNTIDANDPANLTSVSTYQCEGCVVLYRVIVSNGFAYLGLWDFGFEVVDLQNVQQPVFLTRHEIRGGNILLTAENNYLYVISDTTIFDPTVPPRLHIFDIQNPSQPLEVSSLPLSGNRYSKIVITNGYAYLGSEGRLEIIDVSNAPTPQLIGNYVIGTDNTNYWWSMTVDETSAYFVRQSTTEPFQVELIVIDLTDVAQPQQVGIIPVSEGGSDVVVTEDYAYVLGFNGLSVVDVSDPAQPREIGTANFGGGKIYVDGNYLYVAGGESGLLILQVNPNK